MHPQILNWSNYDPSQDYMFNMGLIRSLKPAKNPTIWKPAVTDRFLQLFVRRPITATIPVTTNSETFGKAIFVRFIKTFKNIFIDVKRPYAYASLPDFLPKKHQLEHFHYGDEKKLTIAQREFYYLTSETDDAEQQLVGNSIILRKLVERGLLKTPW